MCWTTLCRYPRSLPAGECTGSSLGLQLEAVNLSQTGPAASAASYAASKADLLWYVLELVQIPVAHPFAQRPPRIRTASHPGEARQYTGVPAANALAVGDA